MGESRVYRSGNEIFVDDFSYSQGISSINGKNYSVDIKMLDEYIYHVCTTTSENYIYVTIRRVFKNQYGEKSYENITIGKIDVAESKKYKSFSYWNDYYGFADMFYKDIREYNEQYNRIGDPYTVRIVPAYYPRSIK
ncbi:MAG: hypothetical protein IKY56_00510 [Alistipes sp.]|nr:hypothetical protein [Alistipes sp.]